MLKRAPEKSKAPKKAKSNTRRLVRPECQNVKIWRGKRESARAKGIAKKNHPFSWLSVEI
jgi:hypothetical protein